MKDKSKVLKTYRDVRPKLQFIDFIHVPTNEAVQLSAQPHLGQEHNNLCILLNSVQRYAVFVALAIPNCGYLAFSYLAMVRWEVSEFVA